MRSSHFYFVLLIISLMMACKETPVIPDPDPDPDPNPVDTSGYSYLALGDSYTKGEGVNDSLRWPSQLVRELKLAGIDMEEPVYVAETSWTSDELVLGMNSANLEDNYDLISILIGVNNQFREYTLQAYEKDMEQIFNSAFDKVNGNSKRIFVLSIPDYSVTPFGKTYNPEKIRQELDIFNESTRKQCEKRGIPFFDITEISRKAADNLDYLAPDNLHPSGIMYKEWVDLILEDIKKELE